MTNFICIKYETTFYFLMSIQAHFKRRHADVGNITVECWHFFIRKSVDCAFCLLKYLTWEKWSYFGESLTQKSQEKQVVTLAELLLCWLQTELELVGRSFCRQVPSCFFVLKTNTRYHTKPGQVFEFSLIFFSHPASGCILIFFVYASKRQSDKTEYAKHTTANPRKHR